MIIILLSNNLLSSLDFGKTSNLPEMLGDLPKFHLFIIVKTYNDTYFNVYIYNMCIFVCCWLQEICCRLEAASPGSFNSTQSAPDNGHARWAGDLVMELLLNDFDAHVFLCQHHFGIRSPLGWREGRGVQIDLPLSKCLYDKCLFDVQVKQL